MRELEQKRQNEKMGTCVSTSLISLFSHALFLSKVSKRSTENGICGSLLISFTNSLTH